MQDRKNEISIINALLCLIVVLIHIVSAPLSRLTIDAPIYKYFLAFHRLSAFVVQAFIFISGMKAFLANKTYKSDKFIL
ncbi:MAG: hypothetical protein ACI4TH_09805, partial [Candidatus Ornithomonoglobus sp.]